MNDQTFFLLIALAFLGFVLTTGALTVAIALAARFIVKVSLVLTIHIVESFSG